MRKKKDIGPWGHSLVCRPQVAVALILGPDELESGCVAVVAVVVVRIFLLMDGLIVLNIIVAMPRMRQTWSAPNPLSQEMSRS